MISFGIPILTALLAAILTHGLSRRRNREDDLHRIRLQAYVDYVGASMRMALAKRQKDDGAYQKELPLYNEAKARICFCAPEPVLRGMMIFHARGVDLEEEQRILAMNNLCRAIRQSLIARPSLGHRMRNRIASLGIGKWKVHKEAAFHLDTAQILFDLEPGKLRYDYSDRVTLRGFENA